ncbi:MAG TPA: hypothetical protein VFZ56_10515 [Gemmatimonadaceae bacterium]
MISARRLALACLVLAACTATATSPAPDIPPWLAAKIQEFDRPDVANKPQLVARYDYKGATVYYVGPRCCDIYSELYDAAGVLLCHPDGGITGTGDGRCTDFLDLRSNEVILWRPDAAGSQP